MKQTRKSQISLFLIVGLVLLLVVSLFVVLRLNMKRADVQQVKQESITFQRLEQDAGSFIDDCIEQAVFESIETYGLDTPGLLENDVQDMIMMCTGGFEFYEDIAEISEEKPSVEVEIKDDIVTFDIEYHVTFSNEEDEFSLKEFSYSFRTNTLIESDNGVVEEGTVYNSKDGKVNLYFSQDTKVTKEGEELEAISFNVEDDNIRDLKNSVVIGSVLYEGLPHGAKFDPAIDVTIELDEEDIQGLDTSALKLAYYDEDADLWITYPSFFDEENMVVRGKVDHFSLISVSMCGSPINGQATIPMRIIPMEFVFKDPFLDVVGDANENGCNPTHWMYNSLDGEFGFHLLPEYMSSFKCEYEGYDMTTYLEGEEFPVEVCELDSEYIQDWDNDDNPEYEFDVGEIMLTYSGTENPHALLLETLSNQQYDIFYEYAKKDCVSLASAFAKDKIKEEFEWVTDNLISGDGIRDGAQFFCNVDLSGTDEDSAEEFMNKVNNGNIEVKFSEENIVDNLENKEKICWMGDVCSDVETMEDYGINPLVIGETRRRHGFFATPKTFGFAFEQQEPFQGLTSYVDIEAIKEDDGQNFHPLLGEGEFTFYLKTGGDACLNYEPSGLGCCVNSQQNGDETVITDCEGKSDESGCGGEFYEKDCHELSQCVGKTNDLLAYIIQEEVEVEDYVIKGNNPSNIKTIASQGGSYPIKSTLATQQGETDLSMANDEEYIPLVYDMSKIEERDWSCSDTCLWTINEEPGKILSETTQQKTETTPASPGKLRSGTNTVKVRVANLNDVCMYARAFLQIKGTGVTFFNISEDIDRPLTEDECRAQDSCWVARENLEHGGFCVVKGEKNGGYCCFGPGDGQRPNLDYPHFETVEGEDCEIEQNVRPMDEMSCAAQSGRWTNGFCVRDGEYNAGYCVDGEDPNIEEDYTKYVKATDEVDDEGHIGCPCKDGRDCLVASECEIVNEYHSVRCSQTELGERMYCCDPKEPDEEEGYEPVGQLQCNPSGNAIIDETGKRIKYCNYGCNQGESECEYILTSCQNSDCYSTCSAKCDPQADDFSDCSSSCQEDCPECYSEIDCGKFPNYETTEWKCENGRPLLQTCGDGNLDSDKGEECDDSNQADGDGCNAECIQEYCGDGLINNVDEECDPGEKDIEGCTDDCKVEQGWTCSGEPSVCERDIVLSQTQQDTFAQQFPGSRVGNAHVLSQMINTCYSLYGTKLKSDLYECLDTYAVHIGQINNLPNGASSGAWPYVFTNCAPNDQHLQCLCYVNSFGVATGIGANEAYGLVGKDSNLEPYTGTSQLEIGKYVIFGDGPPGHIAYIVSADRGGFYYTDANADNAGSVVYRQYLHNHPRYDEITYISKVARV